MYRLLLIGLLSATTASAQPSLDQIARFSLGDSSTDDFFGWAVAIDGDRALVGAPQTATASRMGQAYLFERRTDGTWELAATLTSGVMDSDIARDRFGSAVDLDGDVAVVGSAPVTTSNTPGDAEAYVFERQAGAWTQVATLPTPLARPFESQVAVSGSRIAVGRNADDGVSLYTRGSGGWALEAQVIAMSAGSPVSVGSLDLDDDVLVALGDGDGFVFERQASGWAQTALLASAPDARLSAVAVDAARILAGSTDATTSDSRPGAGGAPTPGVAFVFDRGSGSWAQTAALVPDGAEGGQPLFGRSVALTGARAVVGAPREGPLNSFGLPSERGAVFVFETDGATWAQTQRLLASDSGGAAEFGYAVSARGDRLLAGAIRGESPPRASGAAYVFEAAPSTTSAPPGVGGGVALRVGPNPTAGRATVGLTLSAPETVRVSLHDALGRRVAVLRDGALAAGAHQVLLSTEHLAPGVYVVRAQAESSVASQSLTVLR